MRTLHGLKAEAWKIDNQTGAWKCDSLGRMLIQHAQGPKFSPQCLTTGHGGSCLDTQHLRGGDRRVRSSGYLQLHSKSTSSIDYRPRLKEIGKAIAKQLSPPRHCPSQAVSCCEPVRSQWSFHKVYTADTKHPSVHGRLLLYLSALSP